MESKKIQPWYVQVQVKLEMDFTHLSERDKKQNYQSNINMGWRKNKIFNQIYKHGWGDFFGSVFFDQLILVYDNFEYIKTTRKNLNKMKQRNKQPFSTFISGLDN